MVLGISPFACQEQAATWEEMPADSLGMPSNARLTHLTLGLTH